MTAYKGATAAYEGASDGSEVRLTQPGLNEQGLWLSLDFSSSYPALPYLLSEWVNHFKVLMRCYKKWI